ncbi:MAG: twin-arginine translocase subunit TatB [Cellvibrionaceae bacterium]|nr:twin-arginine translocase subunit TatB [Cellvibrionaceae bacterium]
MFDIGFFELLVIGVVGLLVIGPEQLPGALRTAALWWGRFKRGLQSTRSELEQQIGADDIRRQLHNEEVMQRLNASKQDVERTVNESVSDIEKNIASTLNTDPIASNTDANDIATAEDKPK